MDNVNFLNIQDEEPNGGGGDPFEIYSSDDHHQYYYRNQQQQHQQLSQVMNAEEVMELGEPSPYRSQSEQSPPPPPSPPKHSSSPTSGGLGDLEHRLRNWLQYDLMTMSARKLALGAVAALAVVALLGLAVYGISRVASAVDDDEQIQDPFLALNQQQQNATEKNGRRQPSKLELFVVQNDTTTATISTPTTTTTTTTTTTPKPTTPKPTPKSLEQITSASERATHVRSMTANAWAAYREHAWGHEALQPISQGASHSLFGRGSGRTVMHAMSTLVVMNLTEEFEAGAHWVQDHFNLTTINKKMNVCDLVTDYIGGLLSVWALTGRELFKEKALEIAKMLEPAYESNTGLPYEHFNPNRSVSYDDTVWLTWAGGQLLEYAYLEHLFPEESDLVRRSNRMRSALLKRVVDPDNGLYPERLNVDASNVYRSGGNRDRLVATNNADFGWSGRQFYAALGKSYLLTEFADSEALRAFHDAVDSAYRAKMFANFTPTTSLAKFSANNFADYPGRWKRPRTRTSTTTETPSSTSEEEEMKETLLYVRPVEITNRKKERKEKLNDIFDDDFDWTDEEEGDDDYHSHNPFVIRKTSTTMRKPWRFGNPTTTTTTTTTRRPSWRMRRKEKRKKKEEEESVTTEDPLNALGIRGFYDSVILVNDDDESLLQKKMTYHSCYLGGLLELLAEAEMFGVTINEQYHRLAKGLTRTCILASKRSKSGLAPWSFYFDEGRGPAATNPNGVGFYETAHLMNPEFAESLFIMWRKTADPAYREAAWALVQAMEAHCRTANGGYSALSDVTLKSGGASPYSFKEDLQSPYLFGTLKYLYLIFVDDETVLPLENWVFNTVGHPLPVFSPQSEEHNRRYFDDGLKLSHTLVARVVKGHLADKEKRKKGLTSTTTMMPDISLRLDQP